MIDLNCFKSKEASEKCDHFAQARSNDWNFVGFSVRGSCSYECTFFAVTHRCGLCILSFLAAVSLLMIVVLTILSAQYPEAMNNLLINQQILGVSTTVLGSGVNGHLGRLEMASSSATFLGVCKNSGKRLPNLLDQIDNLAASFKFSQAVFVVGDSDDDTLEVLVKWARRSSSNRTIIASHYEDEIYEELPPFKGMKLPREGRIATARNKGLQTMRTLLQKTDYVINLDMDIIGWSMEGLYDSFSKHPSWDAVCANGIFLHGVYRDTYAFRTQEINTNHHWCGDDHYLYNITEDERSSNRNHLKAARRMAHELLDSNVNNLRGEASERTAHLINADSCFGGLAIYKSEAIQDCEYQYRYSEPPHMLDCEHVLFNKCISTKNNATIVINPNMKLWYGHSSFDSIDPRRVINSILPS